MKFKLSRKRKKQYKKDLYRAYIKYWSDLASKLASEGKLKPCAICLLLVGANKKRVIKSEYLNKRDARRWEEFYFKRRLEVELMYQILGWPEMGEKDKVTGVWKSYDKPIEKYVDNDILLEWYKKHYPEDKLAHHYCKQNRTMWSKYHNQI